MTKSELIQVYRKYEKEQKPFELMVKKKGKWKKVVVIGLSIYGLPIFSGWYVLECFDVEEYMSLGAYYEIYGNKGDGK